jgi:hypothetical protein
MIYIISGLGGARQYDISRQANTFSDPHGFLHLVFSNQSIDRKYIPNDGTTMYEEFKIDESP